MNVMLTGGQREAEAQTPVPPPPTMRAGPWEQSIRLAFVALFIGVGVLALGWATGNIREVPPDSRAVVLRFGAYAREQSAGLLLAWPRPVEEVLVLPAADRQLELAVGRFEMVRVGRRQADAPSLSGDARRNGGFLLTGDGGIVSLRATLTYQVTDPAAYATARAHVPAALERVFVASAVAVLASRDIDTVLVTRPDDAAASAAQGARERLRADLLRDANARLQALADGGAGLGIRVRRVDAAAALPGDARDAFDEVLRATQIVESQIEQARATAAASASSALQQRNALLADARAAAAEQRAQALSRTAAITALAAQPSPGALERIYAERISRLLRKAARVELVPVEGGPRVILPGAKP